MPPLTSPRQRRIRFPVSVPMDDADLGLVDRAAALRSESRASYIRRVMIREANADLRDAERKAGASPAA
jgi:uncharacterized protein (DUF1778 family)